jgi:hypothetical protein
VLVEVLGDLNWIAVAVAAIVYFALGGVWFMPPVFGDRWMRAIDWDGTTEDSPGPAMYIGPLITCVIATIVLALLVHATGATTFAEGLELGLLTGIGLAGTVLFVTGYFDPKKPHPMTWFGIMLGYHGLGFVIAAVILSIWR